MFYITTVVVVLFLVFAGWWGGRWLLGTTEGARWLLESLSSHTKLKISTRNMDGNLLERLHFDGLHLAIGDLEAYINSLDCRLQPAGLLSGAVVIEEMSINGVRINDNGAGTRKPDLSWPKVSGIVSLLNINIKRITINDMEYFTSPQKGVSLTGLRFEGSILWRHSSLIARDFSLGMPYGKVRGTINVGFYQPTLRFDVDFISQHKYLEMEAFSFLGTFSPGKRPEQIAGKIALAGFAKSVKLMDLTGEVGMTRNAFNLRDFRIGRGKRMVAGLEGSILLTSGGPELRLKFSLKDLDLKDETGIATKIGGSLTLDGTPFRYHGSISLQNKTRGWQKADLNGNYTGSATELKISSATASFCEGVVEGSVLVRWERGLVLKSVLRGDNLNPGCFRPEWKGKVNFDIAGSFAWEGGAKTAGRLDGRLRESSLYGQRLQGEIKVFFDNGDISFEKLAVKGRGFAVNGSGLLSQKIHFIALANDLGKLLPDMAGRLDVSGDVRLANKVFSVTARGKGQNVSWKKLRIGKLDFDGCMGSRQREPLSVNAAVSGITYEDIHADQGSVRIAGTILNHTIGTSLKIGKTRVEGSFAGGWKGSFWKGTVESFSCQDTIGPWNLIHPAPLAVGLRKVTIGPFTLTGANGENLSLNVGPGGGYAGELFDVTWANINSRRLEFLLPGEVRYKGNLSGKMKGEFSFDGHLHAAGEASCRDGRVKWHKEEKSLDFAILRADSFWSVRKGPEMSTVLKLSAKVDGKGIVTAGKAGVRIKKATISIDGDEKETTLSADLHPEGEGFLTVHFSSLRPLNDSPQDAGEIKAKWEYIDAGLFSFLIPKDITIAGRLSGAAKGSIYPGRRFLLGGNLQLMPPSGSGEGAVVLKRGIGEMTAGFHTVSLRWNWNDSNLSGSLFAGLVEYGRIDGTFRLPISARLPVILDKKGPLELSLTGSFSENGLLTAIFPGMIRESHGNIEAALSVGGSWERPRSRGRVRLVKAGAYLPHAGIEIKDVELTADITDGVVSVPLFQAKSGTGMIEGKGNLKISAGGIVGCDGVLRGSDFQLIHTPELQVTAAPDLTFSGPPEKLVIRGDIKLPELLIYGRPSGNFSTPSSDVVMEGKKDSTKKIATPKFDAKVRLTLGEHTSVRMGGIDARLAGGMELELNNFDEISSKGEIRVVKGAYNAYGVSLQITRGRLFYSGGSINDPSLDILALRTVGEVKAGVSIGGRLTTPVTKLYSEPVLSDVDTISYIVFGHPLSTRTNAEQIGVLAQAAGLFLSRGKASIFQEKLKKTFGLSTLDIQSEKSGFPGSVGYVKKVGGLSSYQTLSGQAGDISETLISVGKYLTPKLYLSYGRSLFTGSNVFRLRYNINKKWQIETSTGTESGVDLYYRIYFK